MHMWKSQNDLISSLLSLGWSQKSNCVWRSQEMRSSTLFQDTPNEMILRIGATILPTTVHLPYFHTFEVTSSSPDHRLVKASPHQSIPCPGMGQWQQGPLPLESMKGKECHGSVQRTHSQQYTHSTLDTELFLQASIKKTDSKCHFAHHTNKLHMQQLLPTKQCI